MRIFEMASELRKPTCVQVFPASVDLYTPSPGMMLPRMHASPMPMKMVSGLDSETATAPTDELLICPSVTGVQLAPLSIVFQRPPPTAPKYASFGRPFTPETAIERPPRSGPMLRHLSALRIAESSVRFSAPGVWAPGRAPYATSAAHAKRKRTREARNMPEPPS